MNRSAVPVALMACALLAGCESPTTARDVAGPVQPRSACVTVDGRADIHCTPGLANPQVTQGNIGQTICVAGWTDKIRPPTSYTDHVKRELMARYGITAPPAAVELDHLLPLGVGGDPRSPLNLFPQFWGGPEGAYVKDGQERALQRAVCTGRGGLVDAQQQMIDRWTHR